MKPRLRESVHRIPYQVELQSGYALIPKLHNAASEIGVSIEALASEIDLPLGLVRCRFDRLAQFQSGEVARVAKIFATQESRVWNSSFEYFVNRLIPKKKLKQDSDLVKSELSRRLNPFSERLKVCPKCIQEKRGIRLAWQTSWAFACLRHKTLLIDSCPTCHKSIASNRTLIETNDTRDTCHNRIHRNENCTQKLADLPIISLEQNTEILKAQQTLEIALQGESCSIFGKETRADLYLKAIQQILEILWIFLLPQHFEDLPQTILSDLKHFVLVRNRYFEKRSGHSDVEPDNVMISHKWGRVSLMALAMPIVNHLIKMPSQKTVSDEINRIIQRACFYEPDSSQWIANRLELALAQSDLLWHYAFSESLQWIRWKYQLYKE